MPQNYARGLVNFEHVHAGKLNERIVIETPAALIDSGRDLSVPGMAESPRLAAHFWRAEFLESRSSAVC
jgi:hypothetical protein